MTLLEQYMADYQRVCAEKVALQEQLETLRDALLEIRADDPTSEQGMMADVALSHVDAKVGGGLISLSLTRSAPPPATSNPAISPDPDELVVLDMANREVARIPGRSAAHRDPVSGESPAPPERPADSDPARLPSSDHVQFAGSDDPIPAKCPRCGGDLAACRRRGACSLAPVPASVRDSGITLDFARGEVRREDEQ